MATIPVSLPQLAQAALDLINDATLKADDASIAQAAQVRGMLRGIATGQLVIVARPKDPVESRPASTGEPAP